jgi:NitT/TauT family transport system ATP-binding protein
MAPCGIEPFPDSEIARVVGLLELLEDRGGREDGYKIARDLNLKFADLLQVMKTGEVLSFIATPAGDVVLEPLGSRFLQSDVNQRKLIVREQLARHSLFAYLARLLRAQDERSLSREVVLEHLAMLLPEESPERQFRGVVNWGRFAELFGFNQDEERFYLDQDTAAAEGPKG